jgi:hypothetical protein
MEIGIAHINAFLVTNTFLIGEGEHIAWFNFKAVIFNFTHPQFRSLEISEYGDVEGFCFINAPDVLNDFEFVFVRSVRKIQSENIYAGPNEVQQFFIRIAGGSYGSYDLGALARVFNASLLIHICVQVLRNIRHAKRLRFGFGDRSLN